MQSALHKSICDAVAAYGIEIVRSRRLAGYLSDYHSWETGALRNIMLTMIDRGFTESLCQEALLPGTDHTASVVAVTARLIAQGYDRALCDYAVRCVAAALSLIDGDIEAPPGIAENAIADILGITFGDSEIRMVRVAGGTFSLGATFEQGMDANYDERPSVSVTLTDFFLCDRPVTQRLWEAVMHDNPSFCRGADLPVERVTWDECQEFCRLLGEATGRPFRLPTEAQWEYAARGGKLSKMTKYAGCGPSDADDCIWHRLNSDGRSHCVAMKRPNELGIYDLSGNVGEWCADLYYNSYASASGHTDPSGPPQGTHRVVRGGSYDSPLIDCRTSRRSLLNPEYRSRLTGMRLCI